MTNLDTHWKTETSHHFIDKAQYSQSYGSSSSHVWMWELDHKGWAPKNSCFQTMVLEKTLESPLDCKESKPVNPKGNQPKIFIEGRTDTLATWCEEPTHWKRKTEGKRKRGWQRMRWLDRITDSKDMNPKTLWETAEDRGAQCAAVHGSQRVEHNLATEQQKSCVSLRGPPWQNTTGGSNDRNLLSHSYWTTTITMAISPFLYAPPVGRYQLCFHLLAIQDNVAINIHVQVLWTQVFNSLRYIHRNRIAGL